MKSLLMLLDSCFLDMEVWCCVSTTRDRKTVLGRVEHEGLSFLTITLPDFCKDFTTALSDGQVASDHFAGFQRRGGIPLFLRGFLRQVFDPVSGRLLDAPSIECIRSIRQFCLMFSKLELPCSDNRVRKAFQKYVQCENEVSAASSAFNGAIQDDFERIGRLLFADVFTSVDRKVYEMDIIPLHGPGSVANRLSQNGKWRDKTWTRRLEVPFPRERYLFSSDANAFFSDPLPDLIEPGCEQPVRVIHVPKTLKTPRIIAVEPSYMMFMQQGLASALYESIDRSDTLSVLIGHDDQVPNQVLAEQGSKFGTLATLDLSEASDRVSNLHVTSLLKNHPHLLSGVMACRSAKADVPGFGVIPLAKFASMGSALCFPIEMMVFLTIIFYGIERDLNRHVTLRDVNRYRGLVRVYGDDIIVPVHHALAVVSALELFGFEVNRRKSFWSGKFRESCGKEYYDGEDVSVFKLRRPIPSTAADALGVVSAASFRNHAFMHGFWKVAGHIDVRLGRDVLRGHFPRVGIFSPGIGRHTFLPVEGERMCNRLHRPLVRAFRVVSRSPKDPLDGPDALTKIFTVNRGLPVLSVDHLERSGRPRAVDIKLGWTAAQ